MRIAIEAITLRSTNNVAAKRNKQSSKMSQTLHRNQPRCRKQ
jgi:hypothetical protein